MTYPFGGFPVFCQRPEMVEAVRWDGANVEEVAAFCLVSLGGPYPHCLFDRGRSGTTAKLLAGRFGSSGWVDVPAGHWIVRRADGDAYDLWPVSPERFAASFGPGTAVVTTVEALGGLGVDLVAVDGAREGIEVFIPAGER